MISTNRVELIESNRVDNWQYNIYLCMAMQCNVCMSMDSEGAFLLFPALCIKLGKTGPRGRLTEGKKDIDRGTWKHKILVSYSILTSFSSASPCTL